jgi:hypothetical protein
MGQTFGSVWMGLRPTSNYEKPFSPYAISSWGSPPGLPPSPRSARSFAVTSGRFFNVAAGLPPGAELCVNAHSAGDLVAGIRRSRST